jgi:hypothetical protein
VEADVKHKTHDLWELSDSLGVPLDVLGDIISSRASKEVNVGGLKVPVPLHVVSSAPTRTGPMVICRSLGNLGVMAAVRYKAGATCTVWVLDLAKMGKPERMLEDMGRVDTAQTVVDYLRPAIVQQFDKDAKFCWHRVV